jgi:hypothetical protein
VKDGEEILLARRGGKIIVASDTIPSGMTTRPSQSVYGTIQFTAASTTEGQAAGGKFTVALGDLTARPIWVPE